MLVFSTSNSKNSINQRFAKYVANLIPNIKTTLLDINDFEMPIYKYRSREYLWNSSFST
ncbi:NADPH-dependent FMN reductase [Francisella tularensis]|uniref:NADPH-dependent FMN reductase n=1 Tax=Francisella tularensis TaxID=263 RepID=UPI002D7EB3A0|nr:NAD(P)H-dependent oxidoreductase [Francisella tularensis]